METFHLTITAAFTSLTLDELDQLRSELKGRIPCRSLHVAISPCADSVGASLQRALDACSTAFGVSRDEIVSRRRERQVCFARHAYCYLAHTIGGGSLVQVGKRVNRNHATVSHSIRASQDLLFAKYGAYCRPFTEAKALMEKSIGHEAA